MQLVAEPYIPFALWLALAVLAVGVMIWYAVNNRLPAAKTRKALIIGLMSITLALPLGVLLNLTWIKNVPPPAGKPVIRVLIDTSASMATTDIDGVSRLDQAIRIASEASDELQNQFDIRIATFDRSVKSSDLENLTSQTADANESNLTAALVDSINDDVPQGQAILLLSDGIHNAGPVGNVIETATKAQAMDVPIFATTIGGKVGIKNIAVSLRSPQELAFVGQAIPAVVNVQSMGLGNRPVTVEIWQDEKKLDSQEAVPAVGSGDSETAQVTFDLSQNEPGLYRYEVRAEAVEGEATPADNRSTLLFRVVDRPIKMLLVEGKPYWDTKFLVRRLASDQSVELSSVIRMAEGRYLKRTVARSGAPGNEETGIEQTAIIHDVDAVLSADSLTDVQIVVLGRNAEFFLSDDSLDALRNWIARDGGSLVCARGAPSAQISQRLGQILPVRWSMGRESRFRVSMTSQGKELKWLASFGDDDVLGSMPSLATVATAARREGLANVLAATVDSTTDEQVVPVLSYQPYGSGRTVVVEGAGMWRWALMSPEYSDKEDVYSTLWRSLLRWLVSRAGLLPGQNISLQPDRVRFDAGDEPTATMLVRTDKVSQIPSVRLTSIADPGFDQTISPRPVGQDPGVYRLDFGKLPAGQYTAEVVATLSGVGAKESVKTAFDVRERWVEKLELDARSDLMNRIAQESGGAALDDADPAEIAKQFKDHLARSRPPQFRRVAMWDRWWVLGTILGLWATTWILRRRSGLI